MKAPGWTFIGIRAIVEAESSGISQQIPALCTRVLRRVLRGRFLGLVLALLLPVFVTQPLRAEITSIARFEWQGDAAEVRVAGSFNSWSPAGIPLVQSDSLWLLELPLEAGWYYYKLIVDGEWITDPACSLRVDDGMDGWNSVIRVGSPLPPRRREAQEPAPLDKLPHPILDDHPDWVRLYYTAWRMAWNHLAHGDTSLGFTALYLDEGFNDLIYQWDSCFMSAFAVYGREILPPMAALDNFYNRQRKDGYIQRVYHESDGSEVQEPQEGELMLNPPLFAWMEWRYYRITGDDSRINRVLPVLDAYFRWIEDHARTSAGRGLYYNTPLGSGMDNIPRQACELAGWIDMSAQQALAARCIQLLAEQAGATGLANNYGLRHKSLQDLVNTLCWDSKDSLYHDLREDGALSETQHVGAFWPLVAGLATAEQQHGLTSALRDTSRFARIHPVPALAASDPSYNPQGEYWLGGVWAPTNFMVIRGLSKIGEHTLAHSLACAHLEALAQVYRQGVKDENRIAFEERYADGYHTLWECYAPDAYAPGTRWDDAFYGRQDFVGWSGLGPIAILIEDVLGLEIDAPSRRVSWKLHESGRHGIEGLLLGEQRISLVCEAPRAGGRQISVDCQKPFLLVLVLPDGNVRSRELPGGHSQFSLTWPKSYNGAFQMR